MNEDYKICCKRCQESKEIKYFSPQQRIGDGNPHICYDCEKKTKKKKL